MLMHSLLLMKLLYQGRISLSLSQDTLTKQFVGISSRDPWRNAWSQDSRILCSSGKFILVYLFSYFRPVVAFSPQRFYIHCILTNCWVLKLTKSEQFLIAFPNLLNFLDIYFRIFRNKKNKCSHGLRNCEQYIFLTYCFLGLAMAPTKTTIFVYIKGTVLPQNLNYILLIPGIVPTRSSAK